MARFRILVGAALLLGGWPVQAHEGATGVVKERMAAMESMASATKEIRRRIVGIRDFPTITAEAARIAALAQRLPEWFPPGSDAGPSEVPAGYLAAMAEVSGGSRATRATSRKVGAERGVGRSEGSRSAVSLTGAGLPRLPPDVQSQEITPPDPVRAHR
jgi:hypothetical protein